MIKENKFRLNLELSSKVRRRLIDLKDRSDSASYAEVIRRALATFEFILDNEGRFYIKSKEGHEIEVFLP